jgi:hypothetical protein
VWVTVTVGVAVAVGVAVRVAVAVRVEWAGVAEGEEGVGELAPPLAETETETDTEAEAEALAVVVDPPADGLPVLACVLAVEVWPPPAGDGVRVTESVADPDDDVSGVGVKVDGIEEPPAVQAETAIASRTAPVVRRPAVSHASRVAAGVLSRIFMDPPRNASATPADPSGTPGGTGSCPSGVAAFRIRITR